MAFQSADVIAAMERDSGVRLHELRVDGGASRNALAMQFQADILGTPVVRPQISETTSLGAAYLAGLQCGFWNSVDDVKRQWREDGRFVPDMRGERRAELLAGWHRAVDRARGWAAP